MRFLQPAILLCGVLLLAMVNLLPNMGYKGVAHPLEGDVVQVYAADPKLSGPTVLVLRSGESIASADTGQRVTVYLRNDYQGQELWNKPDTTVKILGGFTLLYFLAGIFARRASVRRSPPA